MGGRGGVDKKKVENRNGGAGGGVCGGGGGGRTRGAGAGIVVMTDLILDRYTNQPLFLRFVESCITYKCLKSCFSPVTKAVDKLYKYGTNVFLLSVLLSFSRKLEH